MKLFTKFLFLLTLPISFLLFSCGSTPKVEEKEIQAPEKVIVQEEPEEIIDNSDDVILIDEVVVDETEEEYLRSINNLQAEEVVTKSEFEEDKAAILAIIEDLAEIMEEEDFNAWMNYISKDSKTYYSNPKNIRKAQKKLPDKTLQLYGIKDYFKHVFIPARKNRRVDEIRYISKSYVKAVQVKDDSSIVVYYYFVKENGKWIVHIPEL
ncbi:MAG: hypothetical protein J6C25_07185 [Treponema sp.]|nr:hypothetical protein [Treponema sp.]